MAIVQVTFPTLIRVCYAQEKGDTDYGSCLWARFDLDTQNYTLVIMSDCGNFEYNWRPTPQVESFLDLCRRFNKEYLLDKLSDKMVINKESTVKNVQGLIGEEMTEEWEEELINELYSCCCDTEVIDVINTFCENHCANLDVYEIWSAIEKDYSLNAKKVVDIFMDRVIPVLPKEDKP